jgi:hypothetical protein
MIDDLRNFLLLGPRGGIDLMATNIERGRDLGLPSTWREDGGGGRRDEREGGREGGGKEGGREGGREGGSGM